jgi:hypothetical protein
MIVILFYFLHTFLMIDLIQDFNNSSFPNNISGSVEHIFI